MKEVIYLYLTTAVHCVIWGSKLWQLRHEGRRKQHVVHFMLMQYRNYVALVLDLAIMELMLIERSRKHREGYSEAEAWFLWAVSMGKYEFEGYQAVSEACVELNDCSILSSVEICIILSIFCIDTLAGLGSFKQFFMQMWSMSHICFGHKSTALSYMSLVYTVWDNYLSKTDIWQTIEDYSERRIAEFWEATKSKICQRYFRVPDGLEPGQEYTIYNVDISGISILRFTVQTQFVLLAVGPEGRRHITLLNGFVALEGDWFSLPTAMAG